MEGEVHRVSVIIMFILSAIAVLGLVLVWFEHRRKKMALNEMVEYSFALAGYLALSGALALDQLHFAVRWLPSALFLVALGGMVTSLVLRRHHRTGSKPEATLKT